MKYRILCAITVVMTVALPIGLWFTSDFVHWRMGVPLKPEGASMFTLSHIWGSQMAIAILCGVIWPIPIPATEKHLWMRLWLRSFALALGGGVIGSFLLKPYAWWLAPLLAIFGLVQLSMVGTILGTELRNPNLAQKKA